MADTTRWTRTFPSVATEASTTCAQMLFCEVWSAMPRNAPSGGDVSQPAGVRGRGFEHRKLLGLFRQKLAAKQIGICHCRICHLVDEALFEERVLRMVDAAPHADGDMRVAHGEIDEIVRHVVGHVFKQPLKEIPVDPEP